MFVRHFRSLCVFLVHISALFLIHNKCSFTFALVDILGTITDGPASLGAMKASQLLAAMLTTDLRFLVYLLLMLFYCVVYCRLQ